MVDHTLTKPVHCRDCSATDGEPYMEFLIYTDGEGQMEVRCKRCGRGAIYNVVLVEADE